MPKENTNLPLEALKYLKEFGLTDREALFYCFIPHYQEYGENLDISKLDLAFVEYFPDYKSLLCTLIAKGLYLDTQKKEIYKQSRFFFENQKTRTYWRSRELSALDDGFYITFDCDLIISRDATKGGRLQDFKAIWEKRFFFKNQGDKGEEGKPQQAIKEWLDIGSSYARNNSACEMGNRNGNGNSKIAIANEGIPKEAMNGQERNKEPKEAPTSNDNQAIITEWEENMSKPIDIDENTLQICVGSVLWECLKGIECEKRMAKIEEIYSSIKTKPAKFKELFGRAWLDEKEREKESIAFQDTESPW